MIEKIVPVDYQGKRTDQVISLLFEISRSKAANLCAKKQVLINGDPIAKSHIVTGGEKIIITQLEESSLIAEPPADLPIIYQDEAIIIVNKPVGVAAHPAVGWKGPTVVGILAAQGCRPVTSGDPQRCGIVHRLDVGTTGLMVVAREETAYQSLKTQFAQREVKKIYHTIVQGYLPYETGTIDAPVGRHPKASFKMAVVNGGRNAITHYRLLRKLREASLLEIQLETGRTHQIRVHMQALKHPVLGDPIYGANPKKAAELDLKRQWLHAYQLSFRHPLKETELSFTAPYPEDLKNALEKLLFD